jgi:ubiquinone/menaquinone biosynthesis C-methylase UbiE
VSDPKEIVRRGYDAIADRYDEWAASFETPELRWVGELLDSLPDGSRVLDLGCGGGRTSAQTIAARHRYRAWTSPRRRLHGRASASRTVSSSAVT